MVSKPADVELPRLIERYRVTRELSVGEMCRKLGINRQRYWDWQTNGIPQGMVTLVRLAMREVQHQGRQQRLH
jgi:hypothetical protein